MSEQINIDELERLAYMHSSSSQTSPAFDRASIALKPRHVLSLIDRLRKAEAERDALVGRLEVIPGGGPDGIDCRDATIALQDARIDDLLATCHRLALELECLLLDTKDLAPVSRWWDSAMAALDGWHKAKDAASVRPVPAEPVNARLVEALNKRCYTLSESHLSGYRVVLGFATLEEAQCAHGEIVKSLSVPAEAQQADPPNFCSRCGKRLVDGGVHTCTPPMRHNELRDDAVGVFKP